MQWGVSANLCEAIVRIAAVSGDKGVDIAITWSPSRAVSGDIPNRVKLQSDAIGLIDEAARHFRATSPIEDFELRGVVVGLDRPENAPDGCITVAGFVDSQPRKVQMYLSESEYAKAIQAYDRRSLVACTGELTRIDRTFRLENPRQFRVMEDT